MGKRWVSAGVLIVAAVAAAPGTAEASMPSVRSLYDLAPSLVGQVDRIGRGFYFSLWKLPLVIVLVFIWLLTIDWVNKDSDFVEERQAMWNAINLTTFALGMTFLLVVPPFGAALLLAVAVYAIPTGVYVSIRNGKVTDELKVLTAHHMSLVWERLLVKVGVRVKRVEEEAREHAGAPVDFFNKDGLPAFHGMQSGDGTPAGESEPVLALKELVYDAVKSRATDVHLEPKGAQVAVRFRIDGVLHPTEAFEKDLGVHVLQAVKVMSGMDIAERRKPQDGNFSFVAEEKAIDVRAATAGQLGGEKMALRLLDKDEALLKLEGLGMSRKMEERVGQIAQQPHGLLIVSGPTGSGKTTTLYACLREIDAYQRNIVTLENPVEYHLDNISQRAIDVKSGLTFAESLRSTLRQDPDVIMVGEVRDHETAEIAMQAATTGHMVFTSLHATDTVSSLFRLINLGLESYMIATSVTAVLSQRLVRVLCEECKEPYKPKPEWLRKANLPPDKIDVFYKAVGCEACRGTGYRGRTGIFELMAVSDRIREILRERPSINAIKAEARKAGMLYLQEEGLKKVITGVTSITELLRVTK